MQPQRLLVRESCNQSCLWKDSWKLNRGCLEGEEGRGGQSQHSLTSAVSDKLSSQYPGAKIERGQVVNCN